MSSKLKLRIVVLSHEEVRNRARFLLEPLLLSGHSVKRLRFALSLCQLREIILWFRCEHKPDAVIFISIGLKSIPFIFIARLAGIPMILRLGGHPLEDVKVGMSVGANASHKQQIKLFIKLWICKIFIKFFSYVICVNKHLAVRLKNDLRNNANIYVVPQFSDTGVGSPRLFVCGSANCLTITNLNFLSKAHGVVFLIKQLSKFCHFYGISVNFRVAGDGSFKPVIDDYLKSMDANPLLNIEVLGFVSDVNELYAAADVFIYRSELDGTPNVLLEAKKWGLPTLVNDYAAFQSIISHNENGLIFNNEKDFQDMLVRAINDESLREKISSGARLDHEKRFSKKAVSKNLDSVLKKICEHHAGC